MLVRQELKLQLVKIPRFGAMVGYDCGSDEAVRLVAERSFADAVALRHAVHLLAVHSDVARTIHDDMQRFASLAFTDDAVSLGPGLLGESVQNGDDVVSAER